MSSECSTRLVYRPEYEHYDFGPQHPLRPERLRSSLDLIHALGLGPDQSQFLTAPAATPSELHLVHDPDYVDAVQRLDLFADDAGLGAEAERWGLGSGDSPAFAGMHSVSALIAGGSVQALRDILDGSFQHAFHPAGGLHHAQRRRASGFCLYNDAAIAIAWSLRARESRVLYLDFDAHHGDGVQTAFYDEPRVLTFSIHETGRHLFPGTGFPQELGEGLGRGYSVNLPVEPFTEDDSWLESLMLVIEPLAEWFAPDVIVSQHGCDSHTWDPLTDLKLSTRAFAAQAKLVHALAHRLACGRWLALGGGGYDWVRVVPRSWASVWAEMRGEELPRQLPEAWRSRWADVAERNGFTPIPELVLDPVDAWPPTPRRAEIAKTNRTRAESLRAQLLPSRVRHVWPAYRVGAAQVGLPDIVREAAGDPPESRVATLQTSRGSLLLRDLCPPSMIERLHADPGLAAFTRHSEREFALAMRVATNGHGMVAVAHTNAGTIVGQIVLTASEDWWRDIPAVYELSIETSRDWRCLGVARGLLDFCMQPAWIEHIVLLAMGFDWHWDLERSGLDAAAYRAMLERLFEPYRFRAMLTAEPNVALHTPNLLLVRIGARLAAGRVAALRETMYISPWLRERRAR